MALVICPVCGNEISDKAECCTRCGYKRSGGEYKRYCKECGALIELDCEVCPKCGCPIKEESNTNDSVANGTTGLLKRIQHTKNKQAMIIGILVFLLIIFIVIVAVSNGNSKIKSLETTVCGDWEAYAYFDEDGKYVDFDDLSYYEWKSVDFEISLYPNGTYNMKNHTEDSLVTNNWKISKNGEIAMNESGSLVMQYYEESDTMSISLDNGIEFWFERD